MCWTLTMAKKANIQDIDKLILLVGGVENIAAVTHCITRLRFVLNDASKAQPKEIEELPMVRAASLMPGSFRLSLVPMSTTGTRSC